MTTQKETAASILEYLAPLNVRMRAMFGEYCVYCDEKVFGFICDDRLFIKPSPYSSSFLEELDMAAPYPGAKDYFRVNPPQLEDTRLTGTIQGTADSLPIPKPGGRSRSITR